MIGPIEQQLGSLRKEKGPLFIVLLDPDSESSDKIIESGINAKEGGADVLFIGGSFVGNPNFKDISNTLKQETGLPIVLFPGGASQVSPGPDAILFTTLVSGRNPQYLIDEQVKGAVLAKAYGLEAIPTAYMLIESGAVTAVEYISNTKPIPADKPQIAAAHALASQMMGQRWLYLEAGSGAQNPVPAPMVMMVKHACELSVIVGGGITQPDLAKERVQAGADAIVIGNTFEGDKSLDRFKAFSEAIKG